MERLPSEEFERWLNSPLGIQILAELEHLRLTLIDKAEGQSMEKAYGFTNQAYGVKLAAEQLAGLAVEPFFPKDEQTT